MERMKLGIVVAMLLCLSVLEMGGWCGEAATQRISNRWVEVVPVRDGALFVGFDVLVNGKLNGKLIAPVRFSSNKLITAGQCQVAESKMTFRPIECKLGAGVKFAPDSFVAVRLKPDDAYPLVEFRITLADFNADAWKAKAGNFPFHFLICSMPNADVWHQRGWLMATPKADPFPLLQDVHVGSPEIASNWSRNWSYACPLGAHPIPVIGLWSPQERLYVGYDFQEPRLTDHSEKYIATAYCWKEGADNQFITLVYPHGGKLYQQLVLPKPGSVIASRFKLIYSTDMDSTKDPNLFWQDLLFAWYADKLPRVPRINDMSWMPGGVRLGDFYNPPTPSLIHRTDGKGGAFEEPGTVQIGGWTWHRESPVEVAYHRIKQEKAMRQGGQYVPLFSVVDADGRPFGDAGVYTELAAGEAKGGRILYIWHGLLANPEYGQRITQAVIEWVKERVGEWGKVAIVPPNVSDEAPVTQMLKQSAAFDNAVKLTPEQLVDVDFFNAKRFPIALDLGAEDYIKTFQRSGDGREALINYLLGGGLLMLVGRGPYPMHYAIEIEKGERRAEPLLPQIGVPITGFEEPPTQLFVVVHKDQKVLNLNELPARFDFPASPEPRLRAVVSHTEPLTQLKKELEYLFGKAKRVTIGGEECLFWEKPLEGKWWDNWGGEPVRTLHNSNGWAVALALVDLYRHERDEKYLPFIDGAYNWTKHFVWTRNEFNDVPSSPFAIGGTLSTAFLLDYYFTFRNDPQRRDKARAALDLARSIIYRYMPVWTTDNDEEDNLDPHFLMEPNSGRDWAGLACANEVHWVLDSMTQVYVNTADRRLAYYVRGALQRWYQLYREKYGRSLLDYGGDALSEGLGFFDDCGPGRGGRYDFGAADILPLHWPVGGSLVRVVCGEKAAFATNRNGTHTEIVNYRCQVVEEKGRKTEGGEQEIATPVKGFAFEVRSRLTQPFDVSVSFPFVNISGLPVSIVRDGKRIALEAERDFSRPMQSPSSVYVRGVRNGEMVIIGEVDLKAPVLPVDSGFEYQPPKPEELREGNFEMLALPYDTEVSMNWDDISSFAGLIPGKHYAFKVPYHLAAPEVTGGQIAVSGSLPLRTPIKGARQVFVVYAERGTRPSVELTLDDAQRVRSDAERSALVWRGWPPIFEGRLWMASLQVPEGRKVVKVTPRDSLLFALTVWRGERAELEALLVSFRRAIEESQRIRQAELRMARLRKEFQGAAWEKEVAILPPDVSGKAAEWAGKIGLLRRMARLNRNQLIDSNFFNAKRFPVALYLGGEVYLKTVKKEGDGKQAVIDYLKGGGLLICLASQPFPLYYGNAPGADNTDPLLPQIGLPIAITFEQPPAGVELFITPNHDQTLLNLKDLPQRIPYPQTGDLRLRAINREKVLEGNKYVPLFTVVDAGGNSYGDAAAYVELTVGPAANGKALYIWHRLLDHPQVGAQVLEEVFRTVLREGQ